MTTKVTVFWDVPPCILVDGYWSSKTTCCQEVLKLKAAVSFETSVRVYQTTRRKNHTKSYCKQFFGGGRDVIAGLGASLECYEHNSD